MDLYLQLAEKNSKNAQKLLEEKKRLQLKNVLQKQKAVVQPVSVSAITEQIEKRRLDALNKTTNNPAVSATAPKKAVVAPFKPSVSSSDPKKDTTSKTSTVKKPALVTPTTTAKPTFSNVTTKPKTPTTLNKKVQPEPTPKPKTSSSSSKPANPSNNVRPKSSSSISKVLKVPVPPPKPSMSYDQMLNLADKAKEKLLNPPPKNETPKIVPKFIPPPRLSKPNPTKRPVSVPASPKQPIIPPPVKVNPPPPTFKKPADPPVSATNNAISRLTPEQIEKLKQRNNKVSSVSTVLSRQVTTTTTSNTKVVAKQQQTSSSASSSNGTKLAANKTNGQQKMSASTSSSGWDRAVAVVKKKPIVTTQKRKEDDYDDTEDEDDEEDSEMEDFIDDDVDEYDVNGKKINVSKTIRQMFKYNPEKFQDDDDDNLYHMETSARGVMMEDLRSAKIGKLEDNEMLAEENRRLAEKQKRKKEYDRQIEAKKKKLK